MGTHQEGKSISQNATKGAGDAAHDVEARVALVQVESGVPCGNQICRSGKQSRLEQAKEESHGQQVGPFPRKAKSDLLSMFSQLGFEDVRGSKHTMSPPQSKVIPARKFRGPRYRQTTVEGGWQIM